MTAPSAVELSAEPVLADEDVEQAPVPVALPLWQPTAARADRGSLALAAPSAGHDAELGSDLQGRILGRGWFFLRPLWQVFGMALIFGGIFHATRRTEFPICCSWSSASRRSALPDNDHVRDRQLEADQGRPQPAHPLLLVPFAILGRVFARLSVYWLIAACDSPLLLIAKGHLYLQLNARLLVGWPAWPCV